MSENVVRPFIMSFKDFFDCEFLNVFDRVVIESLKYFAKPVFKGSKISKCTPSIATIAKKSKVSESTVHRALRRLKTKGIIKVVERFLPNKSQTSNQYVLYDFAELWSLEDESEIPKLIEELEERERKERIAALNPNTLQTTPLEPQKTEDTTKEKEIDIIADPDQRKSNNQSQSHSKLLNSCFNFNTGINRSQEQNEKFVEVYSKDFLEAHFNYDVILQMYPNTDKTALDCVIGIIYDIVNTSKQEVRISGQDMPASLVISKILKLDYEDIVYVLDKYLEQTGRIYNQRAYISTLLYNCKEQIHLDTRNRVNYDMANTDWDDFRRKRKELEAQQQQEQEQPIQEQQQEQEQHIPNDDEDSSKGSSSLYDLFKKVKGYKRE